MTESVYDQVHREFLERAKEPGWLMAMEIYLGELAQEIALYHQAHIQAIADQAAMRQITKAKTEITKSYLTMRLTEIRKDKTDFKEGNWVREHGRFARWVGTHETRENPHGTTAQDYHQVVLDELGRKSLAERQSPQSIVGLMGAKEELPVDVSDAEHKGDVITRAAVMARALESKTSDPTHKQRIQFLVTNKDGRSRIITPLAGEVPKQGKERNQIDWEGGERVQYMTPVGPDHPVMVAGHALNLGHVIGMDSERSAKLGSVAQDIHDTINSTSWGKRLQAAANATRVMSNNHPVAVQAHAVATLANLIGPQAARAFGPKLKQLTYRYSGQEASPDQYSEPAKAINNGALGTGATTIRSKELALAHELTTSLPNEHEYKASLQAGSTPPSRGFILDKNGKVVSEAVGFSDDWYAPFNLRKLPNLRGGSYVRSRGYGGITPEDLRLAMRTGAKRVTVVSNNGIFTMEFEPKALHWGHRFGFGGGAMIRRYTKSLDAVKNGTVINPETSQPLKLNSEGYKAAMLDLKMKYPYWVTAPLQSGVPYHQPLHGSAQAEEKQTAHEDTWGYVAPLGIRAQGARAGWAEPGHRELWTDAPSGKYAYDSIDRYQLMHDQKLQVMRALTGTPTTATTSSSSTSTSSNKLTGLSSTQANAGAVKTQRSYPQEDNLQPGQMNSILAGLRRLMRQNDTLDKPASTGQTVHLAELEPYLNVEGPEFTENLKHSGYRELRDKLAANPALRKELATEIGDVYTDPKLSSTVTELLPRLHSETSDEDAGAAAAAEEVGYSENEHIPHAKFANSKEYQRRINQLESKLADSSTSEQDRAAAKKLYDDLNFHREAARQIDAILAQNKKPTLTPEQERRYLAANRVVAHILNQERQQAEDPVTDDGARTSTKGATATFDRKFFEDILASEPDEAVNNLVLEAMNRPGVSNDNLVEHLDKAREAINNARKRAGTAGNQADAEHFRKVMERLSSGMEELEQERAMQSRVDGRNT